MSKTTKISLIGGLILLIFMIMQFKYHSDMEANFNEFQDKKYEIVKNQLNSGGISEYQSHLIAGNIRDETRMLKSTVFSVFLMQSYFTTMSGLIIISLIGYAIKKDENKEAKL